jgi:hypothetical protein
MEMEHMTEYTLSTREIERRKRALTRLLISFVVGSIISSADILFTLGWVVAPGFVVLAGILVLARQLFEKFSNNYAQMKLLLSSQWLERTGKTSRERVELQAITAIRIKRTITGSIREIMMKLQDGRRVFVNALQKFEQFKDELLIRCDEDTVVSEFRELIDYDHPRFYIIFGGIVGVVTTMTIRLMTNLAFNHIQTINFVIAFYVVVMGLYWAFSKPLVKPVWRQIQER